MKAIVNSPIPASGYAHLHGGTFDVCGMSICGHTGILTLNVGGAEVDILWNLVLIVDIEREYKNARSLAIFGDVRAERVYQCLKKYRKQCLYVDKLELSVLS